MLKSFVAAGVALAVGAFAASTGRSPVTNAQAGQRKPEPWPVYGGDPGGGKYSPLTDIDTANVAGLAVAWEWAARETTLDQFGTRPGSFQATPLMIDNVLYFSTPYNRVVALNADSGA